MPGFWNQRTLTSKIHNLPLISCVTLDDLPNLLLFLHVSLFLVMLCSMWYLSSSTKDGPFAPCSGSVDHQGSPSLCFNGDKNGAGASDLGLAGEEEPGGGG